jgi:guanine nucleotide-binding protein G(i) subunit alpha
MGNLCRGSRNSVDKTKGNDKGGAKTIKMLLLGSGESGKSTVFTQVKIIFQQTFTKEELNYYASSIYANVLHTVAKCAEHCLSEKIPFQNEKSQQLTQDLLKVIEGNRLLLLEAKHIYDKTLAETVKTLWNDESVRSQYEKRYQYQFHIPDGAMHFLRVSC